MLKRVPAAPGPGLRGLPGVPAACKSRGSSIDERTVMGKLSFLAGAAVGYVLGARAGRGRYEQIKTQAKRAWSNPKVQHTVSDVGETVKAKAPDVADKLGDAAKSAVRSHTGGSEHTTSGQGPDGHPQPGSTGYGPGGERLP